MHAHLMSALYTEPDTALMQIDLENAFGSLNRTSITQAAAHVGDPQLQVWIEAFLKAPNWVITPWAARASADAPVMSPTADGLAQGDPLSALLFSLTITSILKEAVPAPLRFAAYIDDAVIHGPIIELEAYMVTESLGNHGLRLQTELAMEVIAISA